VSYAYYYRLAVREAMAAELARIRREQEERDARIAATIAANGGKRLRCAHYGNTVACIEHCKGACDRY
jgi:rRNA-processing protein FCF1